MCYRVMECRTRSVQNFLKPFVSKVPNCVTKLDVVSVGQPFDGKKVSEKNSSTSGPLAFRVAARNVAVSLST